MDDQNYDAGVSHPEQSLEEMRREYTQALEELDALKERKAQGEAVDSDISRLTEFLEYLGDSITDREEHNQK